MAIKREKTWQAVVNYTENGKYKKKTKSGFKTKGEATQYEAELKISLKKTPYLVDANLPFVDYYDNWLEEYIKNGISEQTIRNYRATQKIVHEFFSDVLLSDITKPLLQSYANFLASTRKARTVKLRFVQTRIPIEEAFNDGLLPRNPTHGVKLPQYVSKTDPLKVMEISDMNKLLNFIENSDVRPSYLAMYISLMAGLRISEIMALTLNDINFDEKTISVTKSRSITRPYKIGKTKTPSSVRTISVPDKLLYQINRFIAKFPDHDERFLGNDLALETCNYQLKITLSELNIPRISFHGLRHTHASYLINNGIDIAYVSERLGHSNISTTQEVYFHLLQDKRTKEKDKAMDLF